MLLAAAIVLGGALRCYRLGAPELTPDEAASWAAAAAPTLADVVRRQAIFNPGKLAAYELLLHGWIRLAGSGVLTMRLMSAILGVIAIALIFRASREVLALAGGQEAAAMDYTAAATALIAGASLITVRYTREARMYPLLMAAAMAQTAFLLRARRRGGMANYVWAAILTALSIAANFSAVFLVGAQALWLLLTRAGRRDDNGLKPLAAIIAGGVLLLPAVGGAFLNSTNAVRAGALEWISPPAWWRPISFFNRGTGTAAFPVLLVLAIWGAIAQWPRMREAIVFALFWMFLPVLMLFAISIAYTPLLVERYALSSFIPFFLLAAMGIGGIRSRGWRAGALALAVAVSTAHAAAFLAKPPSRQWTHAIAAIKRAAPAARISVAPPHGANVLLYYLPADGKYLPAAFTPKSCAESDLLWLWDHALAEPGGAQVARCRASFPHRLFEEKDVTVLAR